MKCSICGIQIDSLEKAAEEGWEPYFYDGETEYELACPDCAETVLREGQHGEWEVKEEYKGKIMFLDEGRDLNSGEHLMIGIALTEPDGEKHLVWISFRNFGILITDHNRMQLSKWQAIFTGRYFLFPS